MGSESRFTLGLTVRRATTTVAGDGCSQTAARSGSDCSAGPSPSTFLVEAGIRAHVFSHLEDMTEKYPDVCHLVLTLLTRRMPDRPGALFPKSASPAPQTLLDLLHASSITSFTMDAEIVAVDKDTGAYRTFQDLSNRAKKDVRVEDIKVVVGVYAFDLMLLNDRVRSCPDLLLLSGLLTVVLTLHTSRSSTRHSRIAGISSVPSFRPLQTPLTPPWPASVMSNHLIRAIVPIPPPRCRCFSSRSSSRNARV